MTPDNLGVMTPAMNLHPGVALRNESTDVLGVVIDSRYVDAYGNSGPFTYVIYDIQWDGAGSASLTSNQVAKAGWRVAEDAEAVAYATYVLGAAAMEAYSR